MADESFEDLTADAGELGAGHRADGAVRGAAGARGRPGQQIGIARLRWLSASTRTMGMAEAPVLAADPEVAPSDSFALATAAADLAELVSWVIRNTTTSAPRPTPSPRPGCRLAERGVPGATDLLALVDGLEPSGG